MLVLGIETTCDETAAAVVEDGHAVRSNAVASQDELHAEYGGVVPEIASRAHAERIVRLIRRGLEDAGVDLHSVDAIAVSNRPGLIGSLLVGVSAAKALAWSLGIPLIGVDHVRAHLLAAFIGDDRTIADPGARFPAIGLAVSGGHTAVYAMQGPREIERLGGTIDDAAGESFDKAAVMLGLGYPGGPEIDRLAREGDATRTDRFPVANLGKASLDCSFSGLKTAMLYRVRGVPKDGVFPRDLAQLDRQQRADLAAGFQTAAVKAIVRMVKRAAEHVDGVRTIVIGGGVAANTALRTSMAELGNELGVDVLMPPMPLCVDNAAMIAAAGWWKLAAGERDTLDLRAIPTGAAV